MPLPLIVLLGGFAVLLVAIFWFFPLSKRETETVALIPDGEWQRRRINQFKSKGFRLWRLRQIVQETGDLIVIRRILEDEGKIELARFNQIGPYSADCAFDSKNYVWVAANGSKVHPRPQNASQRNTVVVLKNGDIWTEAVPYRQAGQLGYKLALDNLSYEIRWDKKWIRHCSRSGEIWNESGMVGVFDDTQLEAGPMPRILLAFDESKMPMDHRIGIYGIITIGLYGGVLFGRNVDHLWKVQP